MPVQYVTRCMPGTVRNPLHAGTVRSLLQAAASCRRTFLLVSSNSPPRMNSSRMRYTCRKQPAAAAVGMRSKAGQRTAAPFNDCTSALGTSAAATGSTVHTAV
eukprot:GHRQ01016586.1.p2 GENE.GHRQ01016586.1~~GHRQ01016586.1.p2  ORF type:complete len:103 (-),score=18.09 GHRQ01016586.1:493-801(-)